VPGSIRPGPSSPSRAILSQDAAFSVDALCKCEKPWLERRLYWVYVTTTTATIITITTIIMTKPGQHK